MFNVGDLIIYGSTGVCKVAEITKLNTVQNADSDTLYYVLEPVYQKGTIYCPSDNTKVFMRPIMDKQSALQLMDMVGEMSVEPYHNPNIQKLTEHYDEQFKSHDCSDLLSLIISIIKKKRELVLLHKKPGQIDERFLKKSQDLLCGELAVVLGLTKEEVFEKIETSVG
ncbi:MAG: CarD family transcriptional regulator [Clostridia bacterium]|nr:CarD family transcriptional regulator [Clostridia bacterium]